MKKAALLLFIAVYLISFCSLAFADPKLSIPESEFDFGFVPQHSKISHIFWLHSIGTDSLKIISVRPG